jgi:hypothetical protein
MHFELMTVIVLTTNKLIKDIYPRHTNQTILKYRISFCVTAVDNTAGNRCYVMFMCFLPCLFKWLQAECFDGKEVNVTNLCRKLKSKSVKLVRV